MTTIGEAFYTINLVNFFPPNLWQCITKYGLYWGLVSIHRHYRLWDYRLWDYKIDDTSALLFAHTCTGTWQE